MTKPTLPDAVFDQADEVELIDVPTTDLRLRLEEGTVFGPWLAGEAARHFLRESNLIALCELARRRMADRQERPGPGAAPASPRGEPDQTPGAS